MSSIQFYFGIFVHFAKPLTLEVNEMAATELLAHCDLCCFQNYDLLLEVDDLEKRVLALPDHAR